MVGEQCVCDSSGGSIVQPGTTSSFLHAESHLAVRYAVVADAGHLPVTARPGRKDLSRNLHPSLLLHLHALHLREHAKDFGHSASVWSVMTLSYQRYFYIFTFVYFKYFQFSTFVCH